ncbi:OmpP1/FadL family transporter [Derxia gummosa]|uniref:OmpP1/FadL family transporter n=1 Tax=Derxia gummosa DSM 723 TaxID=1121388 RepID=A0A8B6XAY6_9BURK|nr:outer membrane protein transport protein [Derxia gummosa]
MLRYRRPPLSAPSATRASLAAFAIAAALAPQAARATNGYFQHGYGVKSLGAAGTGIALPQDSLAAATNPAGTALVGSRLDAGLTLFTPDRGARIRGNGAGLDGDYDGNDRRHFLIPEFGYTRALSSDLSVGLAVYGNGGMNTSYARNPFGAIGGQGKAGVNLEQLFVTPSVAARVAPGQVLGAALVLAHQRFSARGIGPFAGASQDGGALTDRGTDTSNGAGLKLGWTGELAPGLSLGASWSSKVQGSFGKYRGLFADNGGFDIPATWGVGLAWKPAPAWTLAADWQHIGYGDVGSVGNPLSRLFAGRPLGGADGPGFGWRDVRVVKLGVLNEVVPGLVLRAGYSHASQPVPGDQTFFSILAPGVVQDHATLGFTWGVDAHSEVSGYVARALPKTVSGSGSIPASFGGGEADVRLSETLVGAAWGWKF